MSSSSSKVSALVGGKGKSGAAFAILLPYYNQLDELEGALQSCCAAEGHEQAHLVVVDDGSDQDLKARGVVEKFKGRFVKVTLVENEQNLGVSRSLNAGLAKISEEYFFRLDSDDRVLPNRFVVQLKALSDGFDLVFSEARIVYEGEVIAQTHSPRLSVIKKALPFQNLLMHPTLAARTDFFTERGGYPEKTRSAQDWNFWKLHLNDARAIILDQPLVKLGLNLDSISNSRFERHAGFERGFRLRTALRSGDRSAAIKEAKKISVLYLLLVVLLPNPYRVRLGWRILKNSIVR